jgi:hypothetical protein
MEYIWMIRVDKIDNVYAPIFYDHKPIIDQLHDWSAELSNGSARRPSDINLLMRRKDVSRLCKEYLKIEDVPRMLMVTTNETSFNIITTI